MKKPALKAILITSALALAACGADPTVQTPKAAVEETLTAQVNGSVGSRFDFSERDREAFDRARAERRKEGIPGSALSSFESAIGAFAVNGVSGGLFQVSGIEESPYFVFELTESGWDWAEKALEDEIRPLAVSVDRLREMECYDQDDPRARVCAVDVRFAIAVNSHYRALFGAFEPMRYEGRALFQRTPARGEWEFREFSRAPEPVGDDTPAWRERDEAMGRRWLDGADAGARAEVVAQVRPLLQTRFDAQRTEALAEEAATMGLTFGEPAAGRLTVQRGAMQVEIAQPAQRATSAWGAYAACWSLQHAGHSDWRLIDRAEMQALLRRATAFDGTGAFDVWVSQTLGLQLDPPPAEGAAAPPPPTRGQRFATRIADFLGESALAFDPQDTNNLLIYGSATGPRVAGGYGALTEAPSLDSPRGSSRINVRSMAVTAGGALVNGPFAGIYSDETGAEPLANGGRFRALCVREDLPMPAAPLPEPAAEAAEPLGGVY